MIKIALIGAGKMGISHLAILGAHPDVELVGVCDTSKMVIDALEKYGNFKGFLDYEQMIESVKPEAVFVAVPTKFHFPIVKYLLEKGIHVFAEKPFCLTTSEGNELVQLALSKKLINQVGYHNKFIGTFKEVKKIVQSGTLGELYHFVGEAYGPVVVKKKQESWRSQASEGGGCLMDYASHVIDLLIDILAPVKSIEGSLLKPVFSNHVEDTVYSLLVLENNLSGVLSVNWSDDTYRKMSTSVTIIGTKGKIISDANELKVFFKDDNCPEGYSKGWNVKYITDLTDQVDFYLRGEEYSAQIDYFVACCSGKAENSVNTFYSAWQTDKAIALIQKSSK